MESLMERMYREVGEWMREIEYLKVDEITKLHFGYDREEGGVYSEIHYLFNGRNFSYVIDDGPIDEFLAKVSAWNAERSQP